MKTQKGATLVGSLIAITILSTTLVAVLNLQASIIRSKFFLQYDNTANLLVAEGLEIVRAIYDIRTDSNFPNQASEVNYQVDYTTYILDNDNESTCTDTSIGNSCDMDINSTGAYALSTAGTGNRIFHRFITITNSDTIPKVTSTVVVRNPKGGALRVYKATIELYKID
jgi:Tfp pilus assembly protein PilV